LESDHVAADAAIMTVRDERSRTKAVSAARAMVRRSMRRGANEGWGAAMEEENGTCMRLAASSLSGRIFFEGLSDI
jgi:hypothetical protein